MQTYQDLCGRLADLTALEETLGILQWDQEIVMPEGATSSRARQVATINVLLQEKLADPQLGATLAALQGDTSLDDTARGNLREALRDHRRATRIPSALVRAWSEKTVQAHGVWVEARKANDFSKFEPVLRELVDLARQRAAHLGPGQPAYDALIDEFEPGMTMARLDSVFGPLKAFLVPLIAAVRARQVAGGLPDTRWLNHPVDTAAQRSIGDKMADALGFDRHRGRFDTSVHPFCGGAGPSDVRITTRYNEQAWASSLTAVIHETGHALYEQGRDLALADQPVSRPRSMGVHESQSLLWEKQVGQGRPFWRHHLATLQRDYAFLRDIDLDTFEFGLNLVDLGNFIRVDADELTYPLHVILRYELERDLIGGQLEVADLPAAWNQKMQDYLGIVPPDDALGCLQDVHWSAGLFGYFPCYTLGALYAAQLYRAALAKDASIEDQLALGNTAPLLAFLREVIHRPGSRWPTDELMTRATGEPLNPAHFVAYADAKYRRLYRL